MVLRRWWHWCIWIWWSLWCWRIPPVTFSGWLTGKAKGSCWTSDNTPLYFAPFSKAWCFTLYFVGLFKKSCQLPQCDWLVCVFLMLTLPSLSPCSSCELCCSNTGTLTCEIILTLFHAMQISLIKPNVFSHDLLGVICVYKLMGIVWTLTIIFLILSWLHGLCHPKWLISTLDHFVIATCITNDVLWKQVVSIEYNENTVFPGN